MSLINIYDQHCQCLWSSKSLINIYDQHCQYQLMINTINVYGPKLLINTINVKINNFTVYSHQSH